MGKGYRLLSKGAVNWESYVAWHSLFHVIFAILESNTVFQRTIHAGILRSGGEDATQMTAPNPRAGWEKVGDQFYRKIQLYESVFDPDLELENYLVAGAPYGGAIGGHE